MKFKLIGLVVALIVVAGLVAVAARATGAYFSDSHSGTITGTNGSILISAGVNADTGGGLNFGFTNLLPGEPQSGTVHYQNTGNNPEDVYLVFPDADALKALNNYGTYASVTITGAFGTWQSDNLTDFYPSGTPGEAGVATLYHVPSQMLLESNLAPGATGSFTFTFAWASKLSGTGGGFWNLYPIATESHNGHTYTTPSDETVGQHNGLPYNVVATQVGHDPGMLVAPPLSPAPDWK